MRSWYIKVDTLKKPQPDNKTTILEQKVFRGGIDVQVVQPLLGNPDIKQENKLITLKVGPPTIKELCLRNWRNNSNSSFHIKSQTIFS